MLVLHFKMLLIVSLQKISVDAYYKKKTEEIALTKCTIENNTR